MAAFVYLAVFGKSPPKTAKLPRPPTPWGVRNPYEMGISAEGRQMTPIMGVAVFDCPLDTKRT